VIIQGSITDGLHSSPVTSYWHYNPDDPWAITVGFLDSSAVWNFYFPMFMDVFTQPSDGLHGAGDVLVEISEDKALIHLDNGQQSGTLVFPADEIREFLNRAYNVSKDADEIVSRELEEFLETL
jgi:hypothetical protein